jgi:hypothetical protein
MPSPNRQLLKTVQSIHRQLTGAICGPAIPSLPEGLWRDALNTAHSIATARECGWHAAARIKTDELLHYVEDLQRSLGALATELRDRGRPRTIAGQGDIYKDLVALEEEFPEVQIDRAEAQISVTTEPVILEDIHLGPFQIRLDWQQLQAIHPYRVAALEANPAASNEEITHPHVNGQLVCEGDGRVAIARSLAEGRLYDFFLTVDRILHTYAPGRAYVELENWHGSPCHDCGSVIDEENCYSCCRCEETVCGDCGACCSSCDQSYCCGCTESCEECGNTTCLGCLQHCLECERLVCPNCFTEPLCTQCHDKQSDPDEDDSQADSASQAADAEVHSHGLGQIAVPA